MPTFHRTVAGLAFALAAFLAVPASAAPLSVKASMEEGRTGLLVQVACPALPEKAIVSVTVTREFITPTKHSPVVLLQQSLPFMQAGQAEHLYPMGAHLQVPGRYRVKVAFENQGQYPDVIQKVGDARPEPGEVVLNDWLVSKDYLQALMKEQAFLADALLQTEADLRRMMQLEDDLAAEHAKEAQAWDAQKSAALAAWLAWRPKATELMNQVITHGRDMRDRFYPDTFQDFAETFVFSGFFQAESRKFGTAQGGGDTKTYHSTGSWKGKTMDQALTEMPGLVKTFQKETAWYRLVLLNGLFGAVDEEAANQAEKPDQTRWDRKSREWREILAIWMSDLDRSGPPVTKEVLHRKELAAAGTAVSGWMDALAAKLFDPKNPLGAQADARKKAVRDSFKAAQAMVEK